MDRHAPPPAPDPRELWNDEPSAVFDARTTEQLFSEVDRELRNAEVVRVVDTGWLAVDAFRRDVEDLLAAFCRRGGCVEYQASVPRHAPIPHC